jgi:hypothetical protein
MQSFRHTCLKKETEACDDAGILLPLDQRTPAFAVLWDIV